jgi:AraC-like DNA-binding protein
MKRLWLVLVIFGRHSVVTCRHGAPHSKTSIVKSHSQSLALCLLAYAAQRDLSPENICVSAGVDWNNLRENRITLSPDQLGNVWMECIHRSKDPLFGLHFGETLQLSALGVVGEVVKTSGTVGAALELSFSLLSTVTTTFSIAISKMPDTFTVAFLPSDPGWKDLVAFCQTLDLLMVFLIHELDGLLLKKIKPLKVQYWRTVQDRTEYERILRCRPSITGDLNAVTFGNHFWGEPIITANYQLQQVLLRDFIQPPAALRGMSAQIRDYMLRNSYLGLVSLEGTAANFNMSVRTLQRRLKEEGITFEALADEVRKTIAIGYLKAGAHPVKEVSLMLGYNDLSNFTRTFKRWTGTTPSEYVNKQFLNHF